MKRKLLKDVSALIPNKAFAVGNDLVFIPNFKTSFTDLFKNKVYTLNEIAYCDLFDNSLLRYASTWAAKEAVYKALKQLNFTKISWKNLEIIREKVAGPPHVILSQNLDKFNVSLTISHDGNYVWAIALLQLKESP